MLFGKNYLFLNASVTPKDCTMHSETTLPLLSMPFSMYMWYMSAHVYLFCLDGLETYLFAERLQLLHRELIISVISTFKITLR